VVEWIGLSIALLALLVASGHFLVARAALKRESAARELELALLRAKVEESRRAYLEVTQDRVALFGKAEYRVNLTNIGQAHATRVTAMLYGADEQPLSSVEYLGKPLAPGETAPIRLKADRYGKPKPAGVLAAWIDSEPRESRTRLLIHE